MGVLNLMDQCIAFVIFKYSDLLCESIIRIEES